MKCRHCKSELSIVFIDLGNAPLSNSYLTAAQLKLEEKRFPLKVMVCSSCWLVQTGDYRKADEIFTDDYPYFSSCSSTWLAHAKLYTEQMRKRFKIDKSSNVIEVAANDGYLLRYFRDADIPCFGVEPTKSTASAARSIGIDIVEDFFTLKLARELARNGKCADIMIANNVLAHVPDINDFVSGFSCLLKPHGTATFEFPHIMNLVSLNQFDTIYHEHYSYLSLTAVKNIFEKNGLSVFDVEKLPTHGGSLRVFACRKEVPPCKETRSVRELLSLETSEGIATPGYYRIVQGKADRVKNDFVNFLRKAANDGRKVAGYGAAAKGNTLLNYSDVHENLVSFVADKNPAKQGRFLPGSHIPVVDESRIKNLRPDYVIIFPWNLKEEIMEQLSYIRQWNGRFVTAIPTLEIT